MIATLFVLDNSDTKRVKNSLSTEVAKMQKMPAKKKQQLKNSFKLATLTFWNDKDTYRTGGTG